MTSEIRYDNVDDYLGPRENRFFGDGFKKVTQRVSEVHVEPRMDGTGFIRAKAGLTYPSDWSLKSVSELQPHLSTIDALLLSIQLAEIYLTHGCGLGDDQRRRLWLRRFVLKAGSKPQENLTDVPLAARHVKIRKEPHSLCGNVSTFDCHIGSIRVRCDIEHELGAVAVGDTAYRHAEDLLGDPARRYHGEGYKLRRQLISDLRLDRERKRLTATVQVMQPSEEQPGDGFTAHYQPSLTPIDGVLIMAQISQLLLYHEDSVDRRASNTLWMRTLSVESKTPYQSIVNPFMISLYVDGTELLNLGDGVWRTSAMIGNIQNYSGRVSLAHELPSRQRDGHLQATTSGAGGTRR
jgi:hypothetical protein